MLCCNCFVFATLFVWFENYFIVDREEIIGRCLRSKLMKVSGSCAKINAVFCALFLELGNFLISFGIGWLITIRCQHRSWWAEVVPQPIRFIVHLSWNCLMSELIRKNGRLVTIDAIFRAFFVQFMNCFMFNLQGIIDSSLQWTLIQKSASWAPIDAIFLHYSRNLRTLREELTIISCRNWLRKNDVS